MENNFNLSTLSDAELNEFYANISREILTRREQKSRKAWDKMVSAIKEYLEVENSILISCAGNEFYIDEDSDFNDFGTIVIS